MVLEDLWNGRIIPQEKNSGFNGEFERKKKDLKEEYNLLMSELSLDGKNHLEKYEHLLIEIQSICEEKIFVEAFRLGAKMIMDVFMEQE
jgi:hypothetical protein